LSAILGASDHLHLSICGERWGPQDAQDQIADPLDRQGRDRHLDDEERGTGGGLHQSAAYHRASPAMITVGGG
jgi:hypothetical protein